MTVEQLNEFRQMNRRLRNFTEKHTESDVRLCDMERFVDEVIEYNARDALGGNFSEPLFLHKLRPKKRFEHAQSIPQVCAKRVPDGSAVRTMWHE